MVSDRRRKHPTAGTTPGGFCDGVAKTSSLPRPLEQPVTPAQAGAQMAIGTHGDAALK
jgi:hypothetical protein